MFYAGIDMLFSILFPILFFVVLGMILYTIIGNISTWNKNNHSPRLTVPAAVVANLPEDVRNGMVQGSHVRLILFLKRGKDGMKHNYVADIF